MKKKTKQIILPKTTSKALVIHGCPDQVRAQHLKAYQLQLASLSKANQKMRHYIEIDQPAFTQWWQQKFSDLLTVQVGLEKTFNDLLLLSDAVENYKSHYKCTHQRAYSIVIKAQSNGTLHELMRKIFEEIDSLRQKQLEHDFSLANEAFESLIHESASSNETSSENTGLFEELIPQSPAETSETYLKKMYRDLVRQLHPDTKVDLKQSSEEKILWHELQNAFEWRDLDRMEAIYKTVNGVDAKAIDFASIPIGDILAMKNALNNKLSNLRSEIKLAKKEANWDFENRRKQNSFLNYLAKSIQSELKEHTGILELRIQKLQKRIQGWTRAQKNQKQTSTRRRNAQSESY